MQLYAGLRTTGGRNGAALSGKTVRHVHGLIHAVLEWAMRLEIIERNIADALSAADLPLGDRREAEAHEPAAIAKMLEQTEGTRFWPLIALAVAAGMRRGELCALRWENVDFDEQVITVRESFAVIPGRVWVKTPKSGASRRIALPSLAVSALKKQRKVQAADKLKAGGLYEDGGFVFATELGGHYTPNSLYKVFAREAKRAGLSLTKLHAARHSYATWLIANGVDIATVSKLLGHSEITTTLRVYAHTIKDSGKDALLKIDEQLAKAYGNRMATEDASATKKA